MEESVVKRGAKFILSSSKVICYLLFLKKEFTSFFTNRSRLKEFLFFYEFWKTNDQIYFKRQVLICRLFEDKTIKPFLENLKIFTRHFLEFLRVYRIERLCKYFDGFFGYNINGMVKNFG